MCAHCVAAALPGPPVPCCRKKLGRHAHFGHQPARAAAAGLSRNRLEAACVDVRIEGINLQTVEKENEAELQEDQEPGKGASGRKSRPSLGKATS